MKRYFFPAILLFAITLIALRQDFHCYEKTKIHPRLAPGEYMAQQRMYPYNSINQRSYLEAMEEASTFRNASEVMSYSWEFAGPTNIGGRITDIECHPNSPETIYLGAATGGVWKSSNNGLSWDYLFEDIDLISIGDIAIDPNNENIIYAGTGEANSSSFSFIGNGIYKSEDGGNSWQHSGLELSAYIGRIIVDYNNSDRVFAAACGNIFTHSEARGISRSVDGGTSWNRMLFVNDTVAGIDLVQHPVNPDILYAAMWERTRGLRYRHSYGEGTGIWRSSDGGDTWTELTNGLPSGDVGRPGLTIARSNPDVLYVFYDMPYQEVQVYKTFNGGDSWIRTNDNELYGMNSSFGWYFGQVRVHPADEEKVWVMGVQLYTTSNGGNFWYQGAGWDVHVDHHAMYFDEVNDRILLGNDGGLYESVDNGNSWNKINNLPFTQFYAIDVDYQNPLRLIGGTQDNNTLLTNTGGTDDWYPILGGDGMYCLIDYSNPLNLYAEYQWGNLFKSTDGGNNMEYIGWNWGNDRVNWSAPLAMDPVNPNVLYFGTYRVWKSSNGGWSWDDVSGDITKGIDQYFHTVTTIAVSPLDDNIVIAGTGDGLIHVSEDAGASWNDRTNGIPDRWVTRVTGDPFDENTIYATISGFRWDEQYSHVYASPDLGQNWQDISGDLPDLPVNDIVLDPEHPGYIYVGTDAGVFFTDNYGEQWYKLSDGLPNVSVCAIKIHNPSRTLIIGTYGVSMYKLNLDDLVSVEDLNNDRSAVYQVYPNPFVGVLTIQGKLYPGMSLEAYRMNGSLVYRGSLSRSNNFSNWENGMYLIRILDDQGGLLYNEKVLKQ